MATLSHPPTSPLHHPHKHTLAQGSFGRSSIVRPPVLSLFVRSSDRSIARSIVHGSFVRPFVHPNNLCSAVMLPKFRSFVRPIIRSIVHSFIVPIHRSSFVHSHYSSFVHTNYSPSLPFTITIHHRTIYRYYSSSLLFIDDIYRYYFTITIHRRYLSVIRSPQISTTHPSCCPAHLRPARPIFQSYELR
jgi:hypothetical protein